eukprot:7603562-Ditylum_brightwellii.AAC.1
MQQEAVVGRRAETKGTQEDVSQPMPAEEERTAREEDGTNLPGFVLTPADKKLRGVYRDTIHWNDGCHLDGRITDDAAWHARWR